MSHIAEVNLQVQDLNALERACHRLGLELVHHQQTSRWYGRSVGPTVQSIGSWAACEACHQVIDQGQIEALSQRVCAIFQQKDPRLDQALDDLRCTFLLFCEVRTGPPIPIP